MTAKKKWSQRTQRSRRTPPSAKLHGKGHLRASAAVLSVTPIRKDVWKVATEGGVKNIATSSSSTRVMDEAMVIYERALRNLANR
jgi:hypothetical protein